MTHSQLHRALDLLRAAQNVLAVTPDPRATAAHLYRLATQERVRVVRIDGPELSGALFDAVTALARLDRVIVALDDPAVVDSDSALERVERLARLLRVTVFLPVTLARAATLSRHIVRLDCVVVPTLEISPDAVRAVAELVGVGLGPGDAERVAVLAGGSWARAIPLAHAAARLAATAADQDLAREASRVAMPEAARYVNAYATEWTC